MTSVCRREEVGFQLTEGSEDKCLTEEESSRSQVRWIERISSPSVLPILGTQIIQDCGKEYYSTTCFGCWCAGGSVKEC